MKLGGRDASEKFQRAKLVKLELRKNFEGQNWRGWGFGKFSKGKTGEVGASEKFQRAKTGQVGAFEKFQRADCTKFGTIEVCFLYNRKKKSLWKLKVFMYFIQFD